MTGIYLLLGIIIVTTVVLGSFVWDLLKETEFKNKKGP
jgi:hypothetical protein